MRVNIIILIMVIILSSCSGSKVENEISKVSRELFVHELISTMEIEIMYFKQPKAHEYFNDVEDSSPYAMSLIIAVDSRIIKPLSKQVKGKEPLTFKEALEYIDRAYEFKMKNKYSISSEIRKEIGVMDKKYEKMRDNDFIDEKLKKNMIDILKSKLGEVSDGIRGRSLDINQDLKVYSSKSADTLTIKLDWGRKPTGGYVLKIIEANEVDKNTIEVIYFAKEPGKEDIVTQVITYPSDSIKIKIGKGDNEYNIVLKPKLR